MHPVFFGPIRWYGVMLATGFIIGILYAMRRAKKEGVNPEKILDLSLWLIAAAIIGSRLLFVISYPGYFIEHPLEIIFSRSGFSMFGGVITAVAVGIWYLARQKLPIWKIADIIVPGVALGEIFGRIGCFLNGCCYGKPALRIPWRVIFPYLNGLPAENFIPRHPTQLYYSLFALLTFIFLISLRKHKKFDGEVFWSYLILYSFLRFWLDMFRGDEIDSLVLSYFTVAQLISIAVFFFSVGVLVRFRSKS
ncbi:MAG: prolipoprotein diacylglyceryl transferase [bacterium]|nr:prolipoprotein diacylglyceryl transferase [bacterium]